MRLSNRFTFWFFALGVFLFAMPSFGQMMLPNVNLGFKTVDNPTEVVSVIRIVLILTVLTLAPAILVMMTSFTRLIIVLGFLRQALGVQQLPPNQLIVGLAVFLTFFIMKPAFEEINQQSLQPYLSGQMTQDAAFDAALKPLRMFMYKQTRAEDLSLFVRLSKSETPKNLAEVSTFILVPSFIISELKTAFQIGFMLFLPFLVIDIVVSSVLMAMGMMMLPPIVISLPLKVMLFVLVDGWGLVVGSLIKSFGG